MNTVMNTPATATFNFSSTNKTINLGTLSDNTDDTCAASCHSDSNNWFRMWSADADLTDTTPGSNRCNVCHGQLNNWRSGMSVNHDIANINANNHSQCETCHVAPNSPYSWATHHEDGTMQYNSNSALNYSTTQGTCSSACHDNTSPYNALNPSSIFTGTQGLNGTGVSCTSCHGYPPTTDGGANDKHVAGATAVDHRKGGSSATITGSHNDCQVCHGTKDNGSGGFDNHANYNNHKNNNITMNGPNSPLTGAGYDDTNFGCDAACHNNDAAHQLSDSGLSVDYGDFGAGGTCTGCHTSGGGIGVAQLEVYPDEFDPSISIYGAHRVEGVGTVTPKSTRINTGADLFTSNSFIGTGETSGSVSKDSVLECEDCHDTNGVSDHMGPVDRSLTDLDFMLRGVDTTITQTGQLNTLGQPDYGSPGSKNNVPDSTNMCLNCHRADVYIDGGDNASASISGTSPVLIHTANSADEEAFGWGSGCINCHAAGYWNNGAHGNTGQGGFGSSDFTPGYSGNTGFMNGSAWQKRPDASGCYTNWLNGSPTSWNACSHGDHTGGGYN